jgi:hypothetical protein
VRGVHDVICTLWELPNYAVFAEIRALEMNLTLEQIREKETKLRDEVDSNFAIKYILECQMK